MFTLEISLVLNVPAAITHFVVELCFSLNFLASFLSRMVVEVPDRILLGTGLVTRPIGFDPRFGTDVVPHVHQLAEHVVILVVYLVVV